MPSYWSGSRRYDRRESWCLSENVRRRGSGRVGDREEDIVHAPHMAKEQPDTLSP
jgi:hypothetical protein